MLKYNPKLMPHLHVSVQALDDKILQLMRRKYDAQFVTDILQKVQREVPGVSLTADIIVGFPQEEEINFENTLRNLEKIGFSDLHVFPYSDRERTSALLLDGKIESSEKKRRVREIEKLNVIKYKEYRENMLNSIQRVYIEEIVEDRAFGYTENYIRTFINLKNRNFLELKVSDLVDVRIINFDGTLLEGDVI